MTSFASLMALSATQTKQAQAAVEGQLAERKRKQAEQRRQQEEREQREREQEKKLRLKKLQEDQRQRERLEKLEAERKAREAALQRREDEQRDALRYGPKKAKSGAAGASGSKQALSSSDGTRRRRDGGDSDLEGGGGVVLTREELRQRKMQQEQRKNYQSSRRSTTSTARAYTKAGLRLPGGAVNIVTNQGGHASGEQSPATGRGTKERLAALPNTLVKLNTQKRDKRTEDEIQMQVRAKRQVLEGADAAAFDDWFGDKKKEKQKSPPRPHAPTSSPPSRPITPAVRPSAPGAISASAPASTSQKHDPRAQKPFLSKPTTMSSTQKASGSTPRGASSDAHPSMNKYPKMTKSSSASSAPSSRPAPRPPAAYPLAAQPTRKRPRSPSYDDSPSPPPSKKRTAAHHHRDDIDDPNDVRNMIWQMFGKKRDEYTGMNVFSDDEDMEADAYSLEHEEAKSARIAKMEDLRAQEEERRHEEEKRRRKKERERAAARGH